MTRILATLVLLALPQSQFRTVPGQKGGTHSRKGGLGFSSAGASRTREDKMEVQDRNRDKGKGRDRRRRWKGHRRSQCGPMRCWVLTPVD